MRMKEPSKLDIGAKLFIFLLWLLLSELVQCQNTDPPLPGNEEMALQTFVVKLNLENRNIFKTSCNRGGSRVSNCVYKACNQSICHIEEIVFQNQDLEGEISEEVAELAHLRILDLYSNGLTGTIPSGLGKLSSLYLLDLSYNSLTGTIPACLGTILSLHELDLSNNYLTGSIPFGLGTTFSLHYLDLSYNRLSGSIPANLGKNMHVNVTCDAEGKVILSFTLNLFNNKLVDKIPESLGEVRVQLPPGKTYEDIHQMGTVFRIYLGGNNLSGRIPDSFGKLEYLKLLWLSDNQLSGPLPPELGNLKSIQYLYLNGNNFVKSLPNNYSGLQSLKLFNVAGNCLSGPFPNFVLNWTSIQYLVLRGNQFQGPIDPKIFKMKSLLSLSLAEVESSALLLPEDMNLPNIFYLILRNCSINGSIPQQLGKNSPYLEYLDMSFNNLTGLIPDSLRNSTRLLYMSFAKNMLNGSVPDWIGDKAKSTQIDLSFNNFSDVGSLKGANKQHDLNLFDCCNTNNVPDVSFNLNRLTESICPKGKRKYNSVSINCGGEKVQVDRKNFEEDNSTLPYYKSKNGNWAYTSSGSFLTSKSNSSDRIKSTNCGIASKASVCNKATTMLPLTLLKLYTKKIMEKMVENM